MVVKNYKIKIGYCPTMKNFTLKFANLHNYEAIEFSSAAQVLYLLKLNKLDMCIIGRQAKKSEFEGFVKRIDNGYTLISNSKGMIENSRLSSLEIHTNISKNKIEKLFPELKNMKYHDNLNDALNKGNIQLISWDDWNDDFELLIPIDNQGNKNPKFRVPHIYSNNEDNLCEINKNK